MCFLANFKAPEFELLLITKATLEDIFLDFWELIMDFRLVPLPEAKTQRFKLLDEELFFEINQNSLINQLINLN